MREILFDGKHDVTIDEIVEKMNYFMITAREGMDLYNSDKRACLDIAKRIRSELEKEYKNNSLKRIRELYRDNKWFHYYNPAVHDAVASIVGRITQNNVYSFLYNVESYMRYHLPKRAENKNI